MFLLDVRVHGDDFFLQDSENEEEREDCEKDDGTRSEIADGGSVVAFRPPGGPTTLKDKVQKLVDRLQ